MIINELFMNCKPSQHWHAHLVILKQKIVAYEKHEESFLERFPHLDKNYENSKSGCEQETTLKVPWALNERTLFSIQLF